MTQFGQGWGTGSEKRDGHRTPSRNSFEQCIGYPPVTYPLMCAWQPLGGSSMWTMTTTSFAPKRGAHAARLAGSVGRPTPLWYPNGLHGAACCKRHIPPEAWHWLPAEIHEWLQPMLPTLQTIPKCEHTGVPKYITDLTGPPWFLVTTTVYERHHNQASAEDPCCGLCGMGDPTIHHWMHFCPVANLATKLNGQANIFDCLCSAELPTVILGGQVLYLIRQRALTYGNFAGYRGEIQPPLQHTIHLLHQLAGHELTHAT